MELAQLLGMVRYEILMGWRRGPIRLILVVLTIMPILGFVLFVSQSFEADQFVFSQLTTEAADRLRTALTIGDNIFLIPILIFLIPMMLSETIPLDRQYKMRELMGSLPIRPATYLGGKLIGAYVPVLGAVLIAGAINIGLSLYMRGSFYAPPMLTFWLVSVLLLSLFCTVLGVLLPASQPDRRRAVLFGGIAALVCVVAYLALPTNEMLLASLIQSVIIRENPVIPVAQLPAYPNLLTGSYPIRLGGIVLLMIGMWVAAVWSARRSNAI